MYKKKLLGVDLDDVQIDFVSGLCLFNNRTFGTNLKRSDFFCFELEKIFQCSREETLHRVLLFYKSPEHDSIQPTKGAVNALKALKEKYIPICITARPTIITDTTLKLIFSYFPGIFRDTFFTNFHHGNGKMTKADICKRLGIETFIEDAPVHIKGLEAAGIETHVFDTPWNQHVKETDHVKRSADLIQVAEKLL